MTFDFADIITFTSIFELFLFSLFISLKKFKPNHNKALVLFFLFQMIGITAWIMNKYNLSPNTAKYIVGSTLLWAPSLYLYAKALTSKSISIKSLIHTIPFLVFMIYHTVELVTKIPTFPIDSIVSIQVIVYIIFGLLILVRYHRKVKENFSSDEAKVRNWLAIVMLGYALACITPSVAYYFGFYKQQTAVVKEVIGFLPFLIFYNILFFNAIENPVVIYEIPSEEKYSGSQLTHDQAQQYLQQLDNGMMTHKYFLEPELSLGELSEKIKIPSRYLSQIINQHKQKTFFDYINSLRTEYACTLLTSNTKKTILEILYESGFNSKTSFNTAFKKNVGLTPSQYKMQKK